MKKQITREEFVRIVILAVVCVGIVAAIIGITSSCSACDKSEEEKACFGRTRIKATRSRLQSTSVTAETSCADAEWNDEEGPRVYDIVFYGNGASEGDTSCMEGLVYDEEYSLNENRYIKTGYEFVGWNLADDGGDGMFEDCQPIRQLAVSGSDTVVLYAQWRPIAYNIEFDGNGADMGMTSPLQNLIYDEMYALNSNGYTRKGYTFGGWTKRPADFIDPQYASPDDDLTVYEDEQYIENLSSEPNTTVTLYAYWIPSVYDIYFDGNGADNGTTYDMYDLYYGTYYTLAESLYKRDGYEFLGWALSPTATDPIYLDRDEVINLTPIDGDEITLYAVWTPETPETPETPDSP